MLMSIYNLEKKKDIFNSKSELKKKLLSKEFFHKKVFSKNLSDILNSSF